MFRTSHAMLKTYQDCPLRYKFIYVDRLQDKFKVARPEFTMGQHVHTTLKKLLAEVPTRQRTRNKARELLRQVWTTNRNGFSSRNEEAQYGRLALSMLETFLQVKLKHQPYLLEHNIQYIISDGLMLSGRVDRIDRDFDGALHLIDYKTGNYNPQYIDRGQLAVYSVLITKGLNLPIVSAAYWYLEQNEFITYRPSKTDIDAIIEEIIMTAERIMNDSSFPARPSHVCRWCEFIDICPARTEALAMIKNAT